jgi:hypothetical protein
MLSLKTEFHPYRLRLSSKQPVELYVEVTNNHQKAKMVSMEVVLEDQISFENSGFRNRMVKRWKSFEPGKTFRFYFSIYPKTSTRIGEREVQIRLLEHELTWDTVVREYLKDMPLSVID